MLPFGFALTVRRYGPSDKYGHRPPPVVHTVDNCVVAPAGSTESTGDQVMTVQQDTVYAPFSADIRPTDELVIPEGQPVEAGTYQVDGKPQKWRSPFTGVSYGTVVRLTRASG